MILVAAVAACITVNLRYRTEMISAAAQLARASNDVERLRDANAALAIEVKNLRTDPRTIEAAARSRLSMVRPNEIVMPSE
jgi:cell division protein FtsB